PPPAPGGLFLGEHDEPFIGRRAGRPHGQVVGAGNPVPDRDPPADPERSELMFDLVGTKPISGSAVGRSPGGMSLEAEAERLQLVQVALGRRGIGSELRDRDERSIGGSQAMEQGDVHGDSRSSPRSSAGAEWVNAPTLIRSTPVRATSGALAS